MKICIICLARKGGMINYASKLSNSLSQYNEVTVIVPEDFTGSFSDNIQLVKIKIPTSYFSREVLKFNVLKEINRFNPDIIHITTIHPLLSFLAPFLKKRFIIVTTIHDIKLHLGEWNVIWALSSWILKRYSDKILVHGKWAKDALVNEGISKNKIQIIPLGNLSSFINNPNNIKETNSILFFGRIEDYKGLEYLIMAEPLIKNEINDLKIIIAGEGDFNKYDDLIINKDSFKILNKFIPDEEVPFLFQMTKLVVLPYIECTQTGVVPIAYTFKKPVVVTNVGSIPEIVEDGKTGFIVPKMNHKELAKAIIKILIDDDLRIKMGSNGYNKLEKELSWNIVTEELIKIYSYLLDKKINYY